MSDESGTTEVGDWRRRIDEIDLQLVRLVNARSACAHEIGRLKRRLGMAIYDPAREGEILQRVCDASPGPLDPGAVRRVFERIIDESRRLERLSSEQADGKG